MLGLGRKPETFHLVNVIRTDIFRFFRMGFDRECRWALRDSYDNNIKICFFTRRE